MLEHPQLEQVFSGRKYLTRITPETQTGYIQKPLKLAGVFKKIDLKALYYSKLQNFQLFNPHILAVNILALDL